MRRGNLEKQICRQWEQSAQRPRDGSTLAVFVLNSWEAGVAPTGQKRMGGEGWSVGDLCPSEDLGFCSLGALGTEVMSSHFTGVLWFLC